MGRREHFHGHPLIQQPPPVIRVVILKAVKSVEIIRERIQAVGENIFVVQIHQHRFRHRIGDRHQRIDGAVNLHLRGAILCGAFGNGLQVTLDTVIVKQRQAGLFCRLDGGIHGLHARLHGHSHAVQRLLAFAADELDVSIAQQEDQREQSNDKITCDAAAQS